jgi:hypothetical protein
MLGINIEKHPQFLDNGVRRDAVAVVLVSSILLVLVVVLIAIVSSVGCSLFYCCF